MSPELGLIATVAVFVGAVWYSIVYLKNGIQGVVEGFKYRDKWEIAKGGGRVILVPVVFLGVVVVGLVFIELIYIFQ
jgi:hypothetical protein